MKRRRAHPGEVLREEYLAPLGMSANALAIALSVNAPRVNDIVREKRAVSPEMALRLSRYFQTTPEFWLNLQQSFDLAKIRAEKQKSIEQEVRIRALSATNQALIKTKAAFVKMGKKLGVI